MKKLLVTGAYGLVGSAVCEAAEFYYPDIEVIKISSQDFDLTSERDVKIMFDLYHSDISPIDAVVHCAARVGGIGRNLNSPYRQFTANILMNTNVIDTAASHGIKKLIAFSSVCAFPQDLKMIKEEFLHGGEPYPAHRSYAYSKRMVDIQIEALGKEYHEQEFNYCSVIPGNIFGENDNFNLEDGHVIPSLIRKGHEAARNKSELVVWGTGKAIREFIYSKDIGRACIELLALKSMPQKILVSGRADKIGEIAQVITKHYNIPVRFDSSKPDGQLIRLTDKSLFEGVLPNFKYISTETALIKTLKWYDKTYPNVRGLE
jgi:GDP-L-fucose synthase